MGTQATVFGVWESTRARLKYAIQDYVDACAALKDAMTAPPFAASPHQFGEQILVKINGEMQSSTSYAQGLDNFELPLNLPHDIPSSITLLPPEVLHIILTYAVQSDTIKYGPRSTRPRTTSTVALSSVCRTWRDLMLHTSGFWTSPELILDGTASEPTYELARLWAERSRDAALDLFILESRNSSPSRVASQDWNVSAVGSLMISLMVRARALVICQHFRVVREIHPLLELWAMYGTVGLAKRLDVWRDPDASVAPERLYQTSDTHTKSFTSFFHSLRTLNIHELWHYPDVLVHAGLVELRLEQVVEWYPTLSSIRRILAAAPRLRVLVLDNILVEPFFDDTAVPLDHLHTLVVKGDASWRVLRIIASTSSDIRSSISVSKDPQCLSTVQSFLARTNVSHLCLSSSTNHAFCYVSTILIPMPYLHTLALSELDFCDECMLVPETLIWPALCEVRLIDCTATPHTLMKFISIHVPRTIFLSEGILGGGTNSFDAQTMIEKMLSGHRVRVVGFHQQMDSSLDY